MSEREPNTIIRFDSCIIASHGCYQTRAWSNFHVRPVRLEAFRSKPGIVERYRWPVVDFRIGCTYQDIERIYDGGFEFAVAQLGQDIALTVRNDSDEPCEFSGHMLCRKVERGPLRKRRPPLTVDDMDTLEALANAEEELAAPTDAEIAAAARALQEEYAPELQPNAVGTIGATQELAENTPHAEEQLVVQPSGPPLRHIIWHAGTGVLSPHIIIRRDGTIEDPSEVLGMKPQSPRSAIYCSAAPPRTLVERVIVRCGTGLEGGNPVMAPMVWTWAMQREWERHEGHQAQWRAAAVEAVREHDVPACERAHKHRAARFDREHTRPKDADIFGGTVMHDDSGGGYRCALCGGWLREVTHE